VLHYCTSTMQVIKVFRKDRSRMKTLHSHNCPQESLHLFFGRNPYRITRLFLDNVFHFFVEFFWCVSLDDSSKVFTKLMLKLVCALIQFASLLLSHTLVHLEQGIGAFRLQKDGNWIKLGHVESFNGIRGNIQDAMLSWQRKWTCHVCETFQWFQYKRGKTSVTTLSEFLSLP